ncbi:MAG: hypothetical protein HY698_03795 [Deltaproteobacteria bacterium]|nr:hypothetical protein [Deltaproteobacteria bacterium]
MRGRLINPFLAEIARLDTTATAADPDATGPLVSGYDPDFKETVVLDDAGARRDARQEMPPMLVPCQVEVGAFEALQQLATGTSPNSRVVLVFHFQDLERMGLVDAASGDALIRVNDRLVAIHDVAGNLVQRVRTPPGLYATEVAPQSFGLGSARNLLLVTFDERELGPRGAA